MKNALKLALLLVAPIACSSEQMDTTELVPDDYILDDDETEDGERKLEPALDTATMDAPANELGVLEQALNANENQRACIVENGPVNAWWFDVIVVNNTWTEATCDAWSARN